VFVLDAKRFLVYTGSIDVDTETSTRDNLISMLDTGVLILYTGIWTLYRRACVVDTPR
jgi:hypothetical protein